VLAVLRDNALGAEPASVREDLSSIALDVLGVVYAGRGRGEELRETSLARMERPGRLSSPSSSSMSKA
jgi:hypothetical protein